MCGHWTVCLIQLSVIGTRYNARRYADPVTFQYCLCRLKLTSRPISCHLPKSQIFISILLKKTNIQMFFFILFVVKSIELKLPNELKRKRRKIKTITI